VEQLHHVIELAVVLGVALLVGTLAARERRQAHMVTQRAAQMTVLYHPEPRDQRCRGRDMLPTITTAARTALVANRVVIRGTPPQVNHRMWRMQDTPLAAPHPWCRLC
jgi:K+-sensing histidine kinase KdpD